EDSPTQAAQIQYLLEDMGYMVSVAQNGREGLDFLKKHKPSIIISDIMMPIMDGWELCSRIKSDEELKKIPVIILTTLSDPLDIIRGLKSGAESFIIKPPNKRMLSSRIKFILANKELREMGSAEFGVEIVFADQKHFITPERVQIIDLLFSTFEISLEKNRELEQANKDLNLAKEALAQQAEEDLWESEEKFRAISTTANEAIIMMNEDGNVSYWNEAAEKIFGYSKDEVFGRDLHLLIIPKKYYDVYNNGVKEFKKTGKNEVIGKTIEITALNKKGDEFPIEISVSSVKLKGVWNAVGIIRDITERKMMERQFAQDQKIKSIGQLAAGVAHEINTPTQYIGDNLLFLQDTFSNVTTVLTTGRDFLEVAKAGPVSSELVQEVEKAFEDLDFEYISEEIPTAIEQSLDGNKRVAEIVRAMKEFSHPGVETKTAININRALESTMTVARNEWKYVADMKTDFDTELPDIPCFPGEFNQVILNIVLNATHTISDVIGDGSSGKGTITLSTRLDGDFAEIRISDTGTGIPEKVRANIFDPFFTTKEVGKGTGQGLAISHNVIVEKHGGTISFETEMGKGTTFIIRLPIVPAN
ncbi:MAG: PAS domain S-box protein, partial [Candidatus Latescibacteria bacterium]|nr:PAS domain S-box protein [Candidatus Latescibacterota bacterium]